MQKQFFDWIREGYFPEYLLGKSAKTTLGCALPVAVIIVILLLIFHDPWWWPVGVWGGLLVVFMLGEKFAPDIVHRWIFCNLFMLFSVVGLTIWWFARDEYELKLLSGAYPNTDFWHIDDYDFGTSICWKTKPGFADELPTYEQATALPFGD